MSINNTNTISMINLMNKDIDITNNILNNKIKISIINIISKKIIFIKKNKAIHHKFLLEFVFLFVPIYFIKISKKDRDNMNLIQRRPLISLIDLTEYLNLRTKLRPKNLELKQKVGETKVKLKFLVKIIFRINFQMKLDKDDFYVYQRDNISFANFFYRSSS